MDFNNNPNIGIYMFVNDKFALIGQDIDKKKKIEIEKSLGVPVYKLTILNTELVGLFVCGNNDVLVVPEMFDYELKKFEEICKEHEMKLIIVDEIKNTFGTNVCVGDHVILINSEYRRGFEEKLSRKTKYKIVRIQNKMFNSIGATCRFINGKYFLSQEYVKSEVKDIIDKIGGAGTVNKGSNFVSSGIVGNSNGVILGAMCSTVEIQNIVESLDYL